MVKIALVVNSFPSVSETFILNKAIQLVNAGCDVTIISHMRSAHDLSEDIKKNVKIIKTGNANGWFIRLINVLWVIFLEPESAWEIYKLNLPLKQKIKLIELYRPFILKKNQIIHFTFSGLAIIYLPIFSLLKSKGFKLYVSCRGHAEQIRPLYDSQRKQILKTLFDKIDRIHCVSLDMFNTCVKLGMNPEKAFINRPAVDPFYFSVKKEISSVTNYQTNEKNKRNLLVVSIGRLHWKKDHGTLLKAIQILKSKNIILNLAIAGDGNEYEKLIYQVHLLNIQNLVQFYGSLSTHQVKKLLESADVYAHPSLSEGISNAVMEAMAMGLPVVCTDVGGMNELINNRENGLLVEPMNPNCLAEALEELFFNKNLRKKIGAAARETILHDFSIERQKNIFITEYINNILDQR